MKEDATKKCPACKSDMRLKQGKNGPFWGCIKYPECSCTLSVDVPSPAVTEDVALLAVERFGLAVRFIRDCGGVGNATAAVKAAAEVMGSCAPDAPQEST